MARAFAKRKLRVVAGVHRADQVDFAVNDLLGHGADEANVLGVVVEVSDAASVDALMAAAVDRFGGIDVVCNNVGTSGPNRPAWEFGLDEWDTQVRVNLMGVVHGVRTFAPYLVRQGHGHIVNTSSMAGLTVIAGNGVYSATKHAVVAISETLRLDLDAIGSKVGVSVLCPGPVDTPLRDRGLKELLDHFATVGAQEDLSSATVSTAPPLQPDEVAQLVMDGIESNRLYILPNHGSYERIRERMSRVAEGASIG
jgi:NAD(P)-dependent dehydrogenase (short-subunit alcohol dehydrogenase family)